MLKNIFRFFSGVTDIKHHFFFTTLEGCSIGLYSVFSVEIFSHILKVIENKNIDDFYSYIYMYIGITLVFVAIRLAIGWKTGWGPILYDGAKYLTENYLKKYIKADGNATEKIGTGKFISIIESGVFTWLDMIFKVAWMGSFNTILILYSLIKIFLIGPVYGFLGVALILLGILGSIYTNKKMMGARLIRWEAKSEIARGIVRVLMSKNELLQNNNIEYESKKIWGYLEKARISHETVAFWFDVTEDIPRTLFMIIRVVVYIFLFTQYAQGNTSMADIGIFVLIMAMLEKSSENLLHVGRELLKDSFQMTKLWDTFDSLPDIKGYDEGKIFTPKKENIYIKNISYKYDTQFIFENFSMEIEHGKKTAFVGNSGAGKTTLAKLVAGYLHPQKGDIIVGGQKLKTVALKSYFPHIGYLTQDPGVFDGTIRENLNASTSKNLPDSELEAALLHANCEFIFDMKHGLDTEIGERGVRLSGGQKQRLAIAKVFLKNPEIIILDEPTSALDSFSEEKITEALERLFKGKTVIIIAHRLQTVKKADDIIVLENGQIVERGKHSQLLKQGGIYSKMIELQSGF